ncbi:potassium-transporting ATPase subunit KdpA [Kitasatospora aureofaciens]|uniref:Potassium-transporting ATPase potassium-binding subunit n=3 Tax=Kitasatospora aureofaciens TaxID=1894 RepID=A0A1E7N0A2_KITAU|nr:potassium-transporting ATPase subunit KdpA [Kitasatospora aureofaciens]QEU99166.1 potassium-transporting ATPase subunit KdpA [Streptomyces viridifaciens]ARF77972.1 potassium-transporting ATPase subunit A [Kitasatospora aureofaciens]OEV34112.1 potassium-transporting ATPase subunit A [Kitasatospora aureofaciens]UKZ05213.1 potassium-transporting ATPase subunit KdpA [Streptomyces viridifaciens]GGV06468.1 potassium-transporting ATPase potassium-binding subunit [Kitasatospora aureofaciens]
MSSTLAGWLQVLALVAALVLCYRPLGDYIARILTTSKHLRAERGIYKVIGVDGDADQRWPVYLRSVLAFSAVSVLFLYGLIRLQTFLLLNLGVPQMEGHQAWNTAISFVTNTNWQSYAGESAMGHLVQMAGLAVQNFVSAAVGIAIVAALIRGFTRNRTDRLGNFWVDLVRINLRLLLPISIVFALVLAANGVIQNFHGFHEVAGLAGDVQKIPGGPVASQEVIKELGTNGGGFFNANSSHPFENPTGFTNGLEIFLILLIPFALPRTFGRMVGDNRQGYAIAAVMAIFWVASTALLTLAESQHSGAALQAAGAAMEGKEQRFGIAASTLFASSTTLTSTGAVNSFHDSFTPFGGGITMFNMMLGEIAPGGTGSGLYGMLILAIVAVFVAGLMVGRTPEYLGKKLGGREMKFASLYILTTPAIVLVGTGIAMALPGERAGMLNSGAHGFSEVLYAFTSAANNNGSAFAGITVNTDWYDTALGLCMVLGRFLPMVFVLALAGSLAQQQPVPATPGTLPTHKPLFVGLLSGVVLIVVGLTYFPALALGPIAEGLSS